VPVAAGEQVPVGIKRIEAVVADSVVNTAGLPLERQVVVGVMDSGIDATHPDINYFGGRAWNAPNSNFANDGSADVDNHGHVSVVRFWSCHCMLVCLPSN
jgi:subtilisin family serine protease